MTPKLKTLLDKATARPYGFGMPSGHIYAKNSGVHLATMNGCFEDGPGPFANPVRVKATGELLTIAANHFGELVEALDRIVEWSDAGCDPSRHSIDKARAVLAKIEEEIDR